MKNDALVFAPHPDDEVLGCGGTIIQKTKRGYGVHIVFLTDGSHSHPNIPPSQIKGKRKEEAVAAAHILGVQINNLDFLDFEDGCLARHRKVAEQRVKETLHRIQPSEIYYPTILDLHIDHRACFSIVQNATRSLSYCPVRYEYGIWSSKSFKANMLPFILKEFIASKLGGKTKVQFDISEFYSLKMQALACYKTQTETYEGEPPPLSVSFLQNFQKRYEEFWTYVHPKQNP